jgi:hypothetical protein
MKKEESSDFFQQAFLLLQQYFELYHVSHHSLFGMPFSEGNRKDLIVL